MYVRDVLNDALTFRIFIEISSYTLQFLDFSDLIIFSVSLFAYFSFMFVKGSLKFFTLHSSDYSS